MSATKHTCPHCGKLLQTSQPLDAGKLLLCPVCQRTFSVGHSASLAPQPAASAVIDWLPTDPTAVAPPPVIDWLPQSNPTPAPQPIPPPLPPSPAPVAVLHSPSPTATARPLLAVGLILGGLLFLVGASTLALLVAGFLERPAAAESKPGDTRQVALVSPTTPETSPASTPPMPVVDVQLSEPPADPPLRTDPRPYRPLPLNPTDPPPAAPAPAVPVAAPAAAPVMEGERDGWLPPETQRQVNHAIDDGVAFIKSRQNPEGYWESPRVGMAALPGLTLLECGVPASDPCIQSAVRYVRSHTGNLTATYDLGLALLFLDRLGDPRDEPLIRTLALRLVGGQTAAGGWAYNCPLLTPQVENQLLLALRATKPNSPLDVFVRQKNGKPPEWFVPVKMESSKKASAEESAPPKKPDQPGSTIPIEDDDPLPAMSGAKPLTQAQKNMILKKLPVPIQQMPAILPITRSHNLPGSDGTDNSNSQFATLGLLAASRHDLPLERSLALVVMRFRSSQNADGSWGYQFSRSGNAGSPAMTAAGLLGLAVGHGLAVGDGKVAADHKPEFNDKAVDRGFRILAGQVGKPLGLVQEGKQVGRKGRPRLKGRQNAPVNLYFLWSLERVGVLYHQRQIVGKEWYTWGVELLLPEQHDDGSWQKLNYPGATQMCDTCFALLFLRRANLAKDLSGKLEFVIQDKRPGQP
jgi:hypothetical protein